MALSAIRFYCFPESPISIIINARRTYIIDTNFSSLSVDRITWHHGNHCHDASVITYVPLG